MSEKRIKELKINSVGSLTLFFFFTILLFMDIINNNFENAIGFSYASGFILCVYLCSLLALKRELNQGQKEND